MLNPTEGVRRKIRAGNAIDFFLNVGLVFAKIQ